jgi:hypothetical protein
MVVLTGSFTWRIGEIRVRERDHSRVFAWLTKESPLRPGVMGVSFSFSKGWAVEMIVPMDRTPREFDELQCKTLRLLGMIPMRAEDTGLQVVDFVLPAEAPEAIG